MSDREYYGKEEEKQEEKQDEKWRRDPLSAIVWAGILIWAGLALLGDNMGLWDNLTILGSGVEGWSLAFLGAGLIVLGEVVIRLLMPAYRRGVGGSVIFAIILLGIGLGNLVSWDLVWPLILIGIGIAILMRGFLPRD